MNIFNRKPKVHPKYCKNCGCPVVAKWFVKKTSDFDTEYGIAIEYQEEEMVCSNYIWIHCYKRKTGKKRVVEITGNCDEFDPRKPSI